MQTANFTKPGKSIFYGPTDGHLCAIVGDRVRILADSEATGGQCAIFETITSSGVGPPLHRHAHEDEYFVVQAGRVKFLIDGTEYIAEPGAFVLAPRGTVHSFVNIGKEPSRMIVTVTPGGLERPFRENAELFLRNAQASPAEIAAIFGRYGVELLGPPLTV